MGQLYGTQIASAILTRNPDERRSLLVGMGLSKEAWGVGGAAGLAAREGFFDLVEMVGGVL